MFFSHFLSSKVANILTVVYVRRYPSFYFGSFAGGVIDCGLWMACFDTLPSFLCQIRFNNQSEAVWVKNTLLIINEPVTSGFQQKSHTFLNNTCLSSFSLSTNKTFPKRRFPPENNVPRKPEEKSPVVLRAVPSVHRPCNSQVPISSDNRDIRPSWMCRLTAPPHLSTRNKQAEDN